MMQRLNTKSGMGLRLASIAALAIAAACGTGGNTADENTYEINASGARGVQLKHDAIRNTAAPAGSHLTYYGGKVNAATQAIVVLWGSGSYDSHITSTGTPSMLSFYNQVLSNGSLTNFLQSEYKTAGTSYNGTTSNQNFSNGSASQVITISPSVTSSTISDAQIQTELTNQIAAGHLPAPARDSAGNPVTYYAIFFPPGKTITQGGSSSCVSGGFCAYHGTVAQTSAHNEYYYGVHPDMQAGSGCATGCGNSSTFGNYTSVASHELVEMQTDAEVGISGSTLGPPLAWYDGTNGEIGDICNASQSNYVACDGQTYVMQQEFSNAQSNCINVPNPTCSTTPDFTIASSPSSLSLTAGASGTSTISTTIVGSGGTVTLSVSGGGTGVTGSLSATSISAGSSATLTVSTTSTASGTFTFTVTGTEGTKTHSTTVTVTVGSGGGGGSGITNGGFETGSLSGWTASGAASSVVSGGHSGTYAAQVGSTAATNGDSSIAQTFTAPTGATGLSFYYKVVCPDSVTYDWATATLKDNTAGTTATVLAKTCTNSGAWANATASLTAGHSYTLTLTSHDDNYAGDATYTLYDDVTISTSGGGGGGSGVTNGDFETGSLSGWTASGASASVVTGGYTGSYAARLGSTAATNGDSSISQTFTASGATLTFAYKVVCPDTVTYDWATATLKNNSTGTTTTILAKTCTNSGAWATSNTAVTAGTSYTLTLTSHDDNYSGDPTYTLFDAVSTH